MYVEREREGGRERERERERERDGRPGMVRVWPRIRVRP